LLTTSTIFVLFREASSEAYKELFTQRAATACSTALFYVKPAEAIRGISTASVIRSGSSHAHTTMAQLCRIPKPLEFRYCLANSRHVGHCANRSAVLRAQAEVGRRGALEENGPCSNTRQHVCGSAAQRVRQRERGVMVLW